jgi:hypothetical protein
MPTHASHLDGPHALPIAVFSSGHPLFTNCYQFTDPEGWTAWLTVPAPGIEPGPLTHGE